MKVVNVGFFLFFLLSIYTAEEEADFFRIFPHDFDQMEYYDEDENASRPIPPGFDPNAIEINYSTYIDGDLSIAGSYFPAPGVGNAKKRTYAFPAQLVVTRMSTSPDSKFSDVYSANGRPTATWSMLPSTSTQRFLGVGFGLPASIDITINPTVDIYIAVQSFGITSRVANFTVDVDYIVSGNEMGSSIPATGIKQSITTGNLAIVEPVGSGNLKIYKVSVTLNGALITPGCFCNLFFYRTAPAAGGTEYSNNVYFAAANFNFSVT